MERPSIGTGSELDLTERPSSSQHPQNLRTPQDHPTSTAAAETPCVELKSSARRLWKPGRPGRLRGPSPETHPLNSSTDSSRLRPFPPPPRLLLSPPRPLTSVSRSSPPQVGLSTQSSPPPPFHSCWASSVSTSRCPPASSSSWCISRDNLRFFVADSRSSSSSTSSRVAADFSRTSGRATTTSRIRLPPRHPGRCSQDACYPSFGRRPFRIPSAQRCGLGSRDPEGRICRRCCPGSRC